MTKIELRELITERVGFRAPLVGDFTPDEDVIRADGGRYFQDEHELVKLSLVFNLMENTNATDQEKNEKLLQLKKAVALHVVDECFPDAQTPHIDLEQYPDVFDAAYSKRMAMKVAEMLFASEHSNRQERIAKESVQQVFFDVNGDPNYPNKLSISKAYEMELANIRDRFNTENALDTVTLI